MTMITSTVDIRKLQNTWKVWPSWNDENC